MADDARGAPPRNPQFGEPLPPMPSVDTLRLMLRRRSSSSQTLGAPLPSRDERALLLQLGARAPDHGKLFPWRFLIIEGAAKARLVAGLEAIAAGRPDAETATAKLAKLAAPSLTITVISRVQAGNKIPEWEQELSAGAVCTNLLIAAAALGYGANWITDWYAYDPDATALIGLGDGERIAGFVHVGTPAEPPLERVRPDIDALTDYWAG